MAEAEEQEVEIMSYDEARYLEIEELDSGKIELMNIGVSKLDENSNPTEKSIQYVGDKSKTNKVTGYDNQLPIESDLIKNEKVVEDLYDIFYYRKAGVYAQRNLYLVDLWKPVADQENTYRARKLKSSVIISGKTSTPGETITFSGDLKGIGDFIYGTFNTQTKSFTETV